MEFVAQWRTIGPIGRKTKLLHQHRNNLIARRVVGKFNRYALVLGGVVNRDVDVGHAIGDPLLWMTGRFSRLFASGACPVVGQTLAAKFFEVPTRGLQQSVSTDGKIEVLGVG